MVSYFNTQVQRVLVILPVCLRVKLRKHRIRCPFDRNIPQHTRRGRDSGTARIVYVDKFAYALTVFSIKKFD